MIELKHLQKAYPGGGGVRAVDGVDLALPERGMVAIFGRSGCGKTTLLNCIGGLDAPSGGEVLFDGKPVSTDATELRNRDIGYIFQNYNLSKTLTVYENVALSLRLCGVSDEAEIERRVMAALVGVDMEKYYRRMPDALSGGQQQRVAIARAIVKNPRLILADEPTGNLDEQNTVMVMDLLREISKEHLVLLVTHEAELVDHYCDRVIEMADGHILSERENATTGGYLGKNAGEVFLGDLQNEQGALGEMAITYYGTPEQKPVRLTLLSHGGTLYIKAQTPMKLKLLDESSELHLREGKHEEQSERHVREMPAVLREVLQPTEGTGRMYRLREAIISGFRSNFRAVRRGRKLLIAALVCLPMVVVLMLGTFGTVFDQLRHIEARYDANTVFVKERAADYETLLSFVESGAADLITAEANYAGAYPMAESEMTFCIGRFETFAEEWGSFFYAEGFMRPERLAKGRRLVCGRAEALGDGEMYITTAYADLLLESTGVNYIRSYEDLLYTVGTYQYWAMGGEGQMIIGIVEGEEPELFFNDYSYAQYALKRNFHCDEGYLIDAAHSSIEVEAPARGEVICSDTALANNNAKVGDFLYIGDLKLQIKEILPLSERVDKVKFADYITREYGSFVYRSLSTFSLWWNGFDMTVREEWESFFGKDAADMDYEKELELLQAQYDEQYARDLAEFERREGSQSFGAVLHPEDLQALAAMLPGDQNAQTLNGFNVYRDGFGYGLHAAGDPAALVALLEAEFGEGNVITPEEMHEFYSNSYVDDFIVTGIVIAVIVIAMSLSLYFIMRSSLMGDIKEIGICRAIGVSRRNLIFRYFVETLVLFVLTIFIGFLLSSGALFAVCSLHSVMRQVIFYPVWMALVVLAGLFGISVLCGLAPIWSLLRRTPAEILSKYDV